MFDGEAPVPMEKKSFPVVLKPPSFLDTPPNLQVLWVRRHFYLPESHLDHKKIAGKKSASILG